jgi:hypothetical protein
MNEDEKPLRPAKRKEPVKTSEAKNKTVTVSEDAFLQVGQSAKKLKMSKSKYASAAIAFFAQSGLDPTKELPADLAAVSQKIEGGVASVRAHNADIGNRLFALTRGFEKTMYLFMQQQEHNMNVYLEGIEGNIMRRLVSMEDNLLSPLVEHVMRGAEDALIGRGFAARVYLELMKQPADSWQKHNDKLTEERDGQLVVALRKFMASHATPPAKSTRRPAATPVPPKPVAPAAAPAPAPATTPPKS